jgi:hypothetical protein
MSSSSYDICILELLSELPFRHKSYSKLITISSNGSAMVLVKLANLLFNYVFTYIENITSDGCIKNSRCIGD